MGGAFVKFVFKFVGSFLLVHKSTELLVRLSRLFGVLVSPYPPDQPTMSTFIFSSDQKSVFLTLVSTMNWAGMTFQKVPIGYRFFIFAKNKMVV
jgi:hypothetical protein